MLKEKGNISFVAIISCFLLLAGGSTVGQAQDLLQSDAGMVRLQLDAEGVRNVRVEIFDGESGRPLYDTGLQDGGSVEIPWTALVVESALLKYEVRAWDAAGELIYSQISSIAGAASGAIWGIDFDVIPGGTTVVSPAIRMQGDVEMTADLDVAGATRTAQLLKPSGQPFVGTCAAGSSIRAINASGGVTCEPDNIGGGGDNLGNHAATQNLQMGNNMVTFNNEHGLLGMGGAQIKTGPLGGTFQLFAGAAGNASAMFRNAAGDLRVSIMDDGAHFRDNLHFDNGQKVCSCFNGDGRSTIIASGGWTASTCSGWRNGVCPGGNYQLLCVFESSFTAGTANGGLPSPNCGW